MIEKSCIGNVKSYIEIIRRIEIMVEIMIWIEIVFGITCQTEPLSTKYLFLMIHHPFGT